MTRGCPRQSACVKLENLFALDEICVFFCTFLKAVFANICANTACCLKLIVVFGGC